MEHIRAKTDLRLTPRRATRRSALYRSSHPLPSVDPFPQACTPRKPCVVHPKCDLTVHCRKHKPMNSILSRLTVGSVGLTCKTFLNIGYCSSVTVHGLEHLKAALHSPERDKGHGVITSTFTSRAYCVRVA